MNVIPIEQLIVGKVYRLRARNLRYGVWNGTIFVGIRTKFGERFLDECEVPGSTAFALEEIAEIDPAIVLRAYLGSTDQVTGRPVIFDSPIRTGGRGWVFTDTGEDADQDAVRPATVSNQELFDILNGVEMLDEARGDDEG